MQPYPWPAGSATGVGSMPGTDPAEAVAVVLGELPGFPLPARAARPRPRRGPDRADRRAARRPGRGDHAGGWKFAARPGRDQRRAAGFLAARPRRAGAGGGRPGHRAEGPGYAGRGRWPPPSSCPAARSRRWPTRARWRTWPSRSPRASRRTSPRSASGSRPRPCCSSSTSPRCRPCWPARVPTASGLNRVREVDATAAAAVTAHGTPGIEGIRHRALLRRGVPVSDNPGVRRRGRRPGPEPAPAGRRGRAGRDGGSGPGHPGRRQEDSAETGPPRSAAGPARYRRRGDRAMAAGSGCRRARWPSRWSITPACGLADESPAGARAALAGCREAARILPELIEEGHR